MKRFLMLAALGLVGLCSTTTTAYSQSRDLGAQRLVLDNGSGSGRLTIEYGGTGNGTLTLPEGGGSVAPEGSTLNSTLRWDGNSWIENAGVLSSATGSLTLTGNLALPATSATAGQITVNGQRFMHAQSSGVFLGPGSGNLTMTGTNNIGIGLNALAQVTAGSDNTAIGMASLSANQTGVLNTAVGIASLASTTSGSRNAGIGTYTLVFNTTGESNTAVGNSALRMNVSGNGNTAVGAQALDLSTTSFNTAVGRNSLASLTTGSMNTALGQNSGVSDPTFNNTTSLGYAAVATANNQVMLGNGGVTQVTTAGAINAGTGFTVGGLAATSGQYLRGDGTRFVSGAIQAADLPTGSGSYINNTTTAQTASNFNIDGDGVVGDDLTVGGVIALPTTTATDGQITLAGQRFMHARSGGTYLGTAAGNLNLTSINTGIGTNALSAATTGSANTSVGYSSMSSLTTGNFNTALGQSALSANSTGWNATAIGNSALMNATNGSNTAVGSKTLRATTTGAYNTAVGEDALVWNTAGWMNTAVGYQALINTQGSYNTAMGENTMGTVSSGTHNTGIGFRADVSNGAFSNATAIGSMAIATASNQMMLGNSSLTQVTTAATINSGAGYTVAGAATAGQYLRGNGTRFVSGAIQTADLPVTITASELKFAAGTDKFAGVVTATLAGGASQSFSNTLVTTNSAVIAVLNDADGTNHIMSVTPGAGSFTVNFSSAPSADKQVSFIIINP